MTRMLERTPPFCTSWPLSFLFSMNWSVENSPAVKSQKSYAFMSALLGSQRINSTYKALAQTDSNTLAGRGQCSEITNAGVEVVDDHLPKLGNA
jgi:hypothetical protein